LAGDPAAVRKNQNVKLIHGLGGQQRLPHHRPRAFGGEVILEGAVVDLDLALTGPQEYASYRRLAPARTQILNCRRCHEILPSCYFTASAAGFCAACGWRSPAYTFNFRYICLPSLVFGSIPWM